MKTHIQKDKNNLSALTPDIFVAEIVLGVDSIVEISLVNGQLIIEPVSKQSSKFDNLLLKVDKHNLHQKIDTGMPMGKEMW